jgi:hypothetical protein
MFNRHRTDPEPTAGAASRDDRHVVAVLDRTEPPAFDRAAVRARLTARSSIGLRDRLARPALSTLR